MLIISYKSSVKSRSCPQILQSNSLWIMRYCHFWNDNSVVFKFLTILYSYDVSTLSYNIGPCVKKVFDGEEVFGFNESQEHCKASGGKTSLIRVDSTIWHQRKIFSLESNFRLSVPFWIFDPSAARPTRKEEPAGRSFSCIVGWSLKTFFDNFYIQF